MRKNWSSKMCKFTNRLFVFALLTLGGHTAPAPIFGGPVTSVQRNGDISSILELLAQDTDYDLHYDQRQKGSENLRLKMDGFVIGLPEQPQLELMLFNDDLLDNLGAELLLGIGKSRSSTPAPDNSLSYKVDSLAQKLKPAPKPLEIVEIPAPRKDVVAGRHGAEQDLLTDGGNGSRTKFHIYQLLNLLRRAQRDGNQ